MKNLFYILLVFAFVSCSKVTPSKIKGTWVVTKYETIGSLINHQDPSQNTTENEVYDGSNLISTEDVGGPNETSDTMSNYYSTYRFEKNNEFELIISYQTNENGYPEIISRNLKGTWSLPGKEEASNLEKGDQILLSIYEFNSKSENLNTGEIINSNSTYSSLDYSKYQHTTYTVDELKEDKLILSNDYEGSGYDGQNIQVTRIFSSKLELKKE